MWTLGEIQIGKKTISYQVKHYEEGSPFGIEGGKISKLWLMDKESGEVEASYERGWGKKPQTAEARKACRELMERFN